MSAVSATADLRRTSASMTSMAWLNGFPITGVASAPAPAPPGAATECTGNVTALRDGKAPPSAGAPRPCAGRTGAVEHQGYEAARPTGLRVRTTRRHWSEPALPWSRCRLASDD